MSAVLYLEQPKHYPLAVPGSKNLGDLTLSCAVIHLLGCRETSEEGHGTWFDAAAPAALAAAAAAADPGQQARHQGPAASAAAAATARIWEPLDYDIIDVPAGQASGGAAQGASGSGSDAQQAQQAQQAPGSVPGLGLIQEDYVDRQQGAEPRARCGGGRQSSRLWVGS